MDLLIDLLDLLILLLDLLIPLLLFLLDLLPPLILYLLRMILLQELILAWTEFRLAAATILLLSTEMFWIDLLICLQLFL